MGAEITEPTTAFTYSFLGKSIFFIFMDSCFGIFIF